MEKQERVEFLKEYKKFGDKYIEEKFLKKKGFDDAVFDNLKNFFIQFAETYIMLHVLIQGLKTVKKKMYRKFNKEDKDHYNFIARNLKTLLMIFDYYN